MTKIPLLLFLAILGFPSIARADFGMSMFNAASTATVNIARTTAINSAIGFLRKMLLILEQIIAIQLLL